MNIISRKKVPISRREDIINREEKGQNAFNMFVGSRLEKESASVSIRDPMVKMKLKMFSTCSKVKCNLSDKVVKLREDISLLARFLVVQQCRSELGGPLKEAIGQYEFSVVPHSLFPSDGMLLLPSDKSLFMKLIKEFPTQDISGVDMDNAESAGTSINDYMYGLCQLFWTSTCVQAIERMLQSYTEGRVIFDRYMSNSLKS